MPRYEHLVFVCTNTRAADDPRGSCSQRGSATTLDRLKGGVHGAGLKGRVRVVPCGCLDACATGPTVLVQSATGPAGLLSETWYAGVAAADAGELVERHLQAGERVARLVNPGLSGAQEG